MSALVIGSGLTLALLIIAGAVIGWDLFVGASRQTNMYYAVAPKWGE